MNIKSLKKWSNITRSWPQVVLVKVGLKKDVINLTMHNGLNLLLMNRGEHSDTSVVSDIYFNTPYTKDDFEIQDNWLVLDVGANVGVFSTYVVKQAKNVKVYAYEPAKDNFDFLNNNIKRNNLTTNIKAFNVAVTGKEGKKINLYIHSLGSGGNSLYHEQAKSDKTETVLTTSLNEIIKLNKISNVDLLKLDCEGAEFDILLNSSKNVLSKIRRVAIETHEVNGHSVKELQKFLNTHGFKTYINSQNILCGTK